MSPIKICFIVVFIYTLSGCAAPTPYQPADPYGFSEQQLEDDRYRIRFRGNAQTEREVVENYLLYRAAELTLAKGYDYFLLADRSIDADTRYVYTLSAYPSYGYFHVYPHQRHRHQHRRLHRSLFFEPSIEAAWPITRFEAVATIKLANGEPPADRVDAFNAAELTRHLEPLLKRPDSGG